MKEFTETKLTRTGKRPLAFNGSELHADTTATHNSTRWIKIGVYETDSGKTVVGIGNMTCWQGEHDSYMAEVFNTRKTAMEFIEEFAPQLASDAAQAMNVEERI